uniref:RING-type domain-containing protein n=2 Tax=Wuchereria bancrofti TaxID=6293 RepID=A0A1I8ECZ5_WUCBA
MGTKMSENRSTPCANDCHSATDAHVFMNITDAKASNSDYDLPTMPTMQQCDGICGDIYLVDQLTKFPCLHVLCGMCLNECSLVECDGKFLCPMRECKYLSSSALRLHQSTVTFSDTNNDEKGNNSAESFSDSNASSVAPVAKSHTSKLSESQSDEEMNNEILAAQGIKNTVLTMFTGSTGQ